MARRRTALVCLSAGLLVVSTAMASFAAGAPKIGKRHLVASTFTVAGPNALACPPGKSVAHTTCYLVGLGPGGTPYPGETAFPPNDYRNEVVPVRNGKPGTPIHFSGTELAELVTCSSSTACETIGYSAPLTTSAFIPLHSGKPGKAVPVGGGGTDSWQGIACTSAGNCIAVGQNNAGGKSKGIVVALRSGKAAKPQLFTSVSSFEGVSCLSAKNCVAVGQNAGFNHGVFTDISKGHAGKIHVVKSTGGMSEIACGWKSGSCVTQATKPVGTAGVLPARGVIHGTKVTVTKLSVTSPAFNYVCASVGHCVAFGVVKPNQPGERAVVAVATNGHLGPIAKISGSGDTGSVACVKSGQCEGYASSLTGQFPGDILRTFTVTY